MHEEQRVKDTCLLVVIVEVIIIVKVEHIVQKLQEESVMLVELIGNLIHYMV